MNRNLWAIIAATLAVVTVLVLGFRYLGGPKTQRMAQSDLRTVRSLAELAQQINQKWNSAGRVLPGSLEDFPNSIKQDAVRGKTFGYKPKPDNKYELCAIFARDNRDDPAVNTADPWIHTSGEYCFQFDASKTVSSVPYYY